MQRAFYNNAAAFCQRSKSIARFNAKLVIAIMIHNISLRPGSVASGAGLRRDAKKHLISENRGKQKGEKRKGPATH